GLRLRDGSRGGDGRRAARLGSLGAGSLGTAGGQGEQGNRGGDSLHVAHPVGCFGRVVAVTARARDRPDGSSRGHSATRPGESTPPALGPGRSRGNTPRP